MILHFGRNHVIIKFQVYHPQTDVAHAVRIEPGSYKFKAATNGNIAS